MHLHTSFGFKNDARGMLSSLKGLLARQAVATVAAHGGLFAIVIWENSPGLRPDQALDGWKC